MEDKATEGKGDNTGTRNTHHRSGCHRSSFISPGDI